MTDARVNQEALEEGGVTRQWIRPVVHQLSAGSAEDDNGLNRDAQNPS
jgi:hypothetical protein